MKYLPNNFIYILVTLNGCTAIKGAENLKNHLLDVCPCIKDELEFLFESDEKEFDDLNSLLRSAFKTIFIVACPQKIYQERWRQAPYEIGFNQNLKENR